MTVVGELDAPVSTSCPTCGTTVVAGLLSCPGCRRLVHAETLKEFSAQAEAAAQAGDVRAALVAWRASLDLLPAGSRQQAWVMERISTLSKAAESNEQRAEPPPSIHWKRLGILAPVALLVWKFKSIVVAVLSKGKLLLLGLTKMSTVASMFLTVGVYWTAWGLWFALGVVISIYIHEMGHVAALRRYGIAASAPMFIPGFGALVRLKQMPASSREDARVGLAGPVWGLGAAVAALIAAVATNSGLCAAVAKTGAWLNLFNLMPVWQLDGSRAFSSLTRPQRWTAAAAAGAAWVITRDGVVMLVALVAIARAVAGGGADRPDRGALWQYAFVTLALAAIFRLAALLA